MRRVIGVALGLALAAAAVSPAAAQWRRHGYWGPGAVVGGLAAGALLGGAIAATAAPPVYYAPAPVYGAPVPAYGYAASPDQVAYCARRYKSYDPASGTFLARDGLRYACP